MVWWNPFTWFGKKVLSTGTSLSTEDEHALDILQELLVGEKNALDNLLAQLINIRRARDSTHAESLLPHFRRSLEGFERTAGIIEELLKSKVRLKGTVLESLTSIKKR